MKNALMGAIVGIVIGVLLFTAYSDYRILKSRVSQIEQYLIQRQRAEGQNAK
jgi:hypothetical protein